MTNLITLPSINNKEQQLSLLRQRSNNDRSPCNNETAFTMTTILHEDNKSVK